MNKNIFRALLLGAGAVIAMQQAEAGEFVFGSLRGDAARKALAKIGQNNANNNLNTPLPQGGTDGSGTMGGGWTKEMHSSLQGASEVALGLGVCLMDPTKFDKSESKTLSSNNSVHKQLLKNIGVLYSNDKNNVNKPVFAVAKSNYDKNIASARRSVETILKMITQDSIDQGELFTNYSQTLEKIFAMLGVAIPYSDLSEKEDEMAHEVMELVKYLVYSLGAVSGTLSTKDGLFYKTLMKKAKSDKSFALQHHSLVRFGAQYNCTEVREDYDKDGGVLSAYKAALEKFELSAAQLCSDIQNYEIDLSNK